MSSSLESVATSWLQEQAWQKVFKHTFDVIEDYVAYCLISIGAIALSVRLLTTLGSGDVQCILLAVNSTVDEDLGPYVSGGTLPINNYAQFSQECLSVVHTWFSEYLPYILLIQTIILVVIEKFTFKIPRIAQKVERFYRNIVEESMFGKDPDVAEDMSDPKTSTEAISRLRQRNEICVTLKRSSIIHNVYIIKNVIEVVVVLMVFLPFNISFAFLGDAEESAMCELPLAKIPGLIDEPGTAILQCIPKKKRFFKLAVTCHNVLMVMHVLCSFMVVIWCKYFRVITKLIDDIQAMREQQDALAKLTGSALQGKDFLFLFDLLAHTCGVESTLRVLTHSDSHFHEIFKPNLNPLNHLSLEEDRVKVMWYPADIEKWLCSSFSTIRNRSIEIDSYEVTIFPAEKVKSTQTIPAHAKTKTFRFKLGSLSLTGNGDNLVEEGEINSLTYDTWFYDLDGGRTEYVITIACMIGKSRMKGEKVVTNLVPYGPEKPRAGMIKSAETDQAEIQWDPPKGEFTKYTLVIEKISHLKMTLEDLKLQGLWRNSSTNASQLNLASKIVEVEGPKIQPSDHLTPIDDESGSDPGNIRIMENLSHKLTNYTIVGLEPGEKYALQLGTKTGNVSTNKPVYDIVLTRPLPLKGVRVESITSNSCVVHWFRPSNHGCLKGFQIQVKSASDGKIFKDVSIPRTSKQFTVIGLSPGHDYDVALTSLCSAEEKRRSESTPVEAFLTTMLEKVKSFRQEGSSESTITIKWDGATVSKSLVYRFTIEPFHEEVDDDMEIKEDEDVPDGDDDEEEVVGESKLSVEAQKELLKNFQRKVEVPGDDRVIVFSDLPSGVSSGFPYRVTIQAAMPTLRDSESVSEIVSDIFMTRPAPPTNLRPAKDPLTIRFKPSISDSVTEYKISWVEYSDDPVGAEGDEQENENYATIAGAGSSQKVLSYKFPDEKVKPKSSYRISVQSTSTFKFESAGTKISRSQPATAVYNLNPSKVWTMALSEMSHES